MIANASVQSSQSTRQCELNKVGTIELLQAENARLKSALETIRSDFRPCESGRFPGVRGDALVQQYESEIDRLNLEIGAMSDVIGNLNAKITLMERRRIDPRPTRLVRNRETGAMELKHEGEILEGPYESMEYLDRR